MKKSYVIAIVVAAVSVFWLLSGVIKGREAPEPAGAVPSAAQKEAGPVQVRIRESVAEAVINDVVVTGRTEPSLMVELKAETEGRLTEVLVDKGVPVTEGQILARIEERDRRARAAEARERVKQREIEFNAAQHLEDKGYNSRIRLAEAAADLEAAKAVLAQAEVDLNAIEIKAPFDGIIQERPADPGDYLAKGDVVMVVVDLDPVEAAGFVTEKQVAHLAPGIPARVSVAARSEAQGVLTYIAPAADPQTRTFRIEVSVPNEKLEIGGGVTAKISIPTPETKAHKISPSNLTLTDAGVVGVKIVGEENKVVFVPVRILADLPQYMWVGGLPDKVRLITVGQDFVVPGETVKPVLSDGDGLL